jgi:Flp pilus assembly protein TadG
MKREEGAVAILVALLLVVLMAAVALTVDVGGLYLRRRALVNGADAAALSAARTCARGGTDDHGTTPEVAADTEAQNNSPITDAEVQGRTNITDMTACGARYGHVTVSYTSQ